MTTEPQDFNLCFIHVFLINTFKIKNTKYDNFNMYEKYNSRKYPTMTYEHIQFLIIAVRGLPWIPKVAYAHNFIIVFVDDFLK